MAAEARPAERELRRPLPTLRAVLEGAGIGAHARILQLGGVGGGQTLPSSVLAGLGAKVYVVDPEGADSGDRVRHIGGDPFTAELPDDIDLCVAMPALVRMPDMIEGLLYDEIYDALREGGIVAMLFPRDATDKTLIAQGAAAVRIRSALQGFVEAHFGAHVVPDAAALAAKFDACPYFEFVDVAARTKGAFDSDAFVWLVLRKRPAPSAKAAKKKATPGLPRTPRADQFSLSELEAFLSAVKRAGVTFVPVHEFAERYTAYYEQPAKERQKSFAPFGLVKFDIHGNVRRAYEVAEMLHRLDVPGLFLMMHRHPLNAEYYDQGSTWRMLRRMQSAGHEIGIHADPFCLIREHGDLHRGFKEAIRDLRDRGLTIRTATLHGDTREHIKARGLQANDFFRERYRKTKWDGLPPEGEESLATHVHQYSHRRIAKQFGIEYFAEVNFLKDGQLLNKEGMMYVSDNARAIRITSIPRALVSTEQLSAEKVFVIDDDFITRAAGVLKKRPFLALFHPQWYW
jgi:hypothetical protein